MWAGTTFLGSGTNNTVEYNGVIFGLRAAAQLADMTALHCRGDSALVARQAAGIWQLREPRLAPLLAGVRAEAPVDVEDLCQKQNIHDTFNMVDGERI